MTETAPSHMTMKTCATCRWMREPGEYAQCYAPQNTISNAAAEQVGFDLVGFGEKAKPKRRWEYCSTQRTGGWFDTWVTNSCGRSGRWWLPMENAARDAGDRQSSLLGEITIRFGDLTI
jgi:hypothetical protein